MFKRVRFFFVELRNTLFFVVFFGVATLSALVLYTNVSILSEYSSQIISPNELAVTSSVAIVFGGGMSDELTMSQMQTDRMVTAVNLYKSGQAQSLLLTGDDGARRFDEVSAMYKYAVDQGVSPQDIILDRHGYRTYESCYRAKRVFGITSAMVVSQSFQLPRIAYFCSSQGITVLPISADLRVYTGWWTPKLREVLARTKGWIQTEITKPTPLLVP